MRINMVTLLLNLNKLVKLYSILYSVNID